MVQSLSVLLLEFPKTSPILLEFYSNFDHYSIFINCKILDVYIRLIRSNSSNNN